MMSSMPSSPSWASMSSTSSDNCHQCHHCKNQGENPVTDAPAEVRELIRAKYDAGVPLFSKEQLRDLAEQMDRCKRESKPGHGQLASVKGLDGKTIKHVVEIGAEVYPRAPGTKVVVYVQYFPFIAHLTRPALRYNSIEPLLEWRAKEPGFEYEDADVTWYLPVEIALATETRDTATGEVLKRPYRPCGNMAEYAAVRDRLEHEWEHGGDSDEVHDLCKYLRDAVKKEVAGRLTKVVAFACGRMCWRDDDDEDDAHAGSTVAQHVLVLMMKYMCEDGALGRGGEVKCFAQDPAYTAADKRVLRNKGVTVLENPRGFLEVDDDSLVISASPTVPVRQIVADIARPTVLIWDRVVDVEENGVTSTDPVSKRVVEMMRDYVELPWSPEKDCFNSLAVYVRKDAYVGEA